MIPIHLDQVSKTYGEAPSADPTITVDLTIRAGEFFTLLGPSGCGKSTLLRMVAGFVAPTTGRIRFGDRDVTNVPSHKRGIGMVFQNYALFPHMSVAENVAYGLRLRRVPRSERARRTDDALRRVDLDGYGGRRIDQLSGGQQQRVALARSIVIEPTLLLLDEPLSNLDAKLREETRMEIRDLQRSAETTAVYVTHDQAEAMAMSDRIAVLADGKAHQIDTPRTIYREPATAFVARFIGRSNVVPVTVSAVREAAATITLGGGAQLIVPRSPGMSLEPGTPAEASVRPESLRFSSDDEAHLRGVVTGVEYMGSATIVAIDVEGTAMTVSSADGAAPERGERVGLVVDAEKTWLIPE